jgi:hypothetical protein
MLKRALRAEATLKTGVSISRSSGGASLSSVLSAVDINEDVSVNNQ